MTGHDDGQVVLAMRDDPHVIHRPCAAAQAERQDDMWKDEIFVVVEETLHLAHNQNAGLLDVFYQLLFIHTQKYFCLQKYCYFWILQDKSDFLL